MTVASEISRLQTDKECMRQAIIGKGVDVCASVSLDDYAACINAIESGSAHGLNVLVVGGGGGGNYQSGGGGGAVVCRTFLGKCSSINVYIGCGGATYCNGGTSCICNAETRITAGGGFAGRYGYGITLCGGSSGNGYAGGLNGDGNCGWCAGGGGGGAGGPGCPGSTNWTGGQGGPGLYGYGGGGGGGAGRNGGNGGAGVDGGGNGTSGNGCNATGYGGGGGGACMNKAAGRGCQGMVEICYPTDGSYCINSATGGQCCYTCDGYCVHRFTSNGTFTITG